MVSTNAAARRRRRVIGVTLLLIPYLVRCGFASVPILVHLARGRFRQLRQGRRDPTAIDSTVSQAIAEYAIAVAPLLLFLVVGLIVDPEP